MANRALGAVVRSAPGNPEPHAREMISKALEIGVSVLAITDHNNVSSISVFR